MIGDRLGNLSACIRPENGEESQEIQGVVRMRVRASNTLLKKYRSFSHLVGSRAGSVIPPENP